MGLMTCSVLSYFVQRGSQGLSCILIFWKEFDGSASVLFKWKTGVARAWKLPVPHLPCAC